MPLACPVTCPCRRAGEGAFLLAGAVYAALAAPLFLGNDLGALIGAALDPPHAVPLPLLVWALAVLAGVVLLGIALRALLMHGDGPPARSSFVVVVIAVLALGCGWYPRTMGATWFYGMRGFYLALIAGGAVNLLFALCSQVWQRGFVAAERGQLSYAATLRMRQQAEENAHLRAERDRLAHDLAHLPPPSRDAETVLQLPGVARAVLAALHPDRARSDADKIAATERFQTAAALLERIGKQ